MNKKIRTLRKEKKELYRNMRKKLDASLSEKFSA